MAKIKGNNLANVLDGTSAKDWIKGYGGDDTINGLGGSDVLDGGHGNDTIAGGDGNDRIDGGKGNDTITGGGGNDVIDGGKGIDTAVFSGNYAQYVIDDGHHHHHGHGHGHGYGHHHHDHDELTVTDTVLGRDGTDRLDDVEWLKFNDATVNTDTGQVAQWHYAVNAMLDAAGQDPAQSPGHMYAGSGLSAGEFGIARNEDAGIELGLKVHHRGSGGGPVYVSSDDYDDGVLHFEVQDGPAVAPGAPKAEWSFDYSIVTGLNGETTDLGDFTFKLLYDVDPGTGTSYKTLTLEAEGTPQAAGQSGYQWRDADTNTVFIVDDEGNANVTQNSENYSFAFFQAFLTDAYGPGNNFAGPAYFDIELQAFDGAQLIAQNHISVDVIL